MKTLLLIAVILNVATWSSERTSVHFEPNPYGTSIRTVPYTFLEVDASVEKVKLQDKNRDCGDRCEQFRDYFDDQVDLRILSVHRYYKSDSWRKIEKLQAPESGMRFKARFLFTARRAIHRKILFVRPMGKCSKPWRNRAICINPYYSGPLLFERKVPVFRTGVYTKDKQGDEVLTPLEVGDKIRVQVKFWDAGSGYHCIKDSDCKPPQNRLGEVNTYVRIDD
jgi:hypothetical protein